MRKLLTIFVICFIFFSCSKEQEPLVIAPVSGFTYTIDKADYKKIQFQNASHSLISGSSYIWSFGDGEASTVENPVHTFKENGNYQVTLKVTNGNLVDIAALSIIITNTPFDSTAPEPIILFTYSQNARVFQFQNASTRLLTNASFNWNFGDGNVSSDENPTHAYANDGIFSVVLKVTNNGKSYSCYKSVISSASSNPNYDTIQPVPMFVYSIEGKKVDFVNTSSFTTAKTTYTWNFGDGQVSPIENPSHVFDADGVYNVVLKVSNGLFTVSYTVQLVLPYKDPIVINPVLKPDAEFVYSQQNAAIYFQNSSSNITPSSTYYWTFGNEDHSDEENPFYTYLKAGTYNVVLKVTTGNVSDSYSKTVVIP
jgi:PKD repeat protein